MPMQVKEENDGRLLVVYVTRTLDVMDYERFVPEFKRPVQQHGKLDVLFGMNDF